MATPDANPEVVLIQMPFGQLFWPSIGLSLLQAELAREDIAAKVLYLTLPFAEAIGLPLYTRIADGRRPRNTDLAGEWVFAEALFGDAAPPAESWIEQVLRARALEP